MSRCFMQSKMGSYTKINALYNILAVLYSLNKKKHLTVSMREKIFYFCTKKNRE
jgi:hypothetical protein